MIEPKEHDLVIVCDGTDKLKVRKVGMEVNKVSGIQFRLDYGDVPEVVIKQLVAKFDRDA